MTNQVGAGPRVAARAASWMRASSLIDECQRLAARAESRAPRYRMTVVPCVFALIFTALLAPTAAVAQTAEQIKALQGLTKTQRDALLQQAGGAGAATGAPTPSENQIVVQQSPGQATDSQTSASLVIKGGEQVLIQLALAPVGADAMADSSEASDAKQQVAAIRDRLLKGNPYTVTPEGVLQLPGFNPILLAGLTSIEAQQRLALDSSFKGFAVTLTLLRVAPKGTRALKPFGYDMLRGTSTAFVPGTDIPVPDDYKLGPGDILSVQLYGQRSQVFSLPVGRDGSVAFPDLGPITLGGMNFAAARALLEGKVGKQFLGTRDA